MSDELRAETKQWLMKRVRKVRARGLHGMSDRYRLDQMMKLEQAGLSYAEISHEVGLSHTQVSKLITREQRRQKTLAKK